MVEWLAGNRITGTNAERTSTTGFNTIPAVAGGWKEVGRTTLGSASDIIDVASLADKRYYMVLADIKPTGGNIDFFYNFNADTGGNYATRRSEDGAGDGTVLSNTNGIIWGNNNTVNPAFSVGYFSNLSTKEKLTISHAVHQNTAGAGTAPLRVESVGKWSNISNPISTISIKDAGSNQYNTDSECVVLGWDPEDTHTTNFWEELASVELGSAATEISSGTIAAKKYLWVQSYCKKVSSGRVDMRFNSDTVTNYANRYSLDGGADLTNTGHDNAYQSVHSTSTPSFSNMFIINNSANEKLVINHQVDSNTAGAGNAPTRDEIVSKWANTSSQITNIKFYMDAVNMDAGSIIKVWGSD